MKQYEEEATIPFEGHKLLGNLIIPQDAIGLVLFAHGSGSSRFSPRNQAVARFLREGRIATLLMDLLTADEEAVDIQTRHHRFDIIKLATRLVGATEWLEKHPKAKGLGIGYFGSSTGAAAALVAAAEKGDAISSVVSRGGRPDLAGQFLPQVLAPTLLIVGGNDDVVIELNQQAYEALRCEKDLKIVPEATHLFEEPGTLEQVEKLARAWFVQHFSSSHVG
jgi:putative phosphoribosyl transferase